MLQVVLYKSRGLMSSLIKWQTDSDYSHAALLTDHGLYESIQGKGVILTPADDLQLSNCDVFNIINPIPNTPQVAYVEHLLKKELGKSYDYWGALRFISRRRLPENDKWFCSELVMAVLKQAGINLLVRVEPYQVSPGDISHSPRLTLVESYIG